MNAGHLYGLYENASIKVIESFDLALMAAEAVTREICETGTLMGKQVKEMSEKHLPKPVAIIVQKAFDSLPVFAVYATLPYFITLPALALVVIASIADAENAPESRLLSDRVHANIWHGIAIAKALNTASSAIELIKTAQVACLISTIVQAIATAILYERGNFYYEAAERA